MFRVATQTPHPFTKGRRSAPRMEAAAEPPAAEPAPADDAPEAAPIRCSLSLGWGGGPGNSDALFLFRVKGLLGGIPGLGLYMVRSVPLLVLVGYPGEPAVLTEQ